METILKSNYFYRYGYLGNEHFKFYYFEQNLILLYSIELRLKKSVDVLTKYYEFLISCCLFIAHWLSRFYLCSTILCFWD